jgi:signal transduction histidine kinase
MFNNIKFKITATAFLIISVIMMLSAWRNIKETEQKLLNGQKEKAVLLSDRIAHGVMMLMLQNKWQDLQAMMEGLVTDATELKHIRILRPENGKIVVSSEPGDIGKAIPEVNPEMLVEGDRNAPTIIEKGGDKYASKLTFIKNLPVCHRCHGPEKKVLGILDIQLSLSKVTVAIEKFKKKHLNEAFLGFFLIAGTFVLVVGVLIDRPIRKMIRTIRRIENGDLSARMEEGKKDEFGLVAKSFNSMLESLESAKKEIEIYHAEQMQRAAKLASLGEIVSGIAHEIKNPLTGISCAVQVLQSDMNERDGNRELTNEILNHIKRLDSTIKDLLNYAKPKPPRFEPLKISSILDKTIFFVYTEARKQKVIIETEIEGEEHDVMMDSDQMQQIFLNLIINAVQAMPDGGKLTIVLSEKDKKEFGEDIADIFANDRVLEIRFEDTGKGIDRDYLDSIFDPFFTKKSKGTGLGLAISQRIIHEHGGEITVQSKVGKGSIFTVYLPVVE